MALTANTPRTYELGDRNQFPIKAAAKIYEGSAVGIEVASGYARALVAGDVFVGFAEFGEDAPATNGAKSVRVHDEGKVVLAVSGAAITDLGKPVYASDDATFTFTATGNSYVGRVVRFISTGLVVVAFARESGGLITPLTDNSGGSASDTLAAISDAATKNAVASLAAKVNLLIQAAK